MEEERKDVNIRYNNNWVKSPLRRKKWVDEFCNLILDEFSPASIIDFGCGTGDILAPFEKRGLKILGIDGSNAVIENLKISKKNFILHDLRDEFINSEKFDLCFSLEVAEHIEEEYEDIFLQNLSNTSKIIIFTASNRKSTYHPNAKEKEHWIEKFSDMGFSIDKELTEKVRHKMEKIDGIQTWYTGHLMIFKKI